MQPSRRADPDREDGPRVCEMRRADRDHRRCPRLLDRGRMLATRMHEPPAGARTMRDRGAASPIDFAPLTNPAVITLPLLSRARCWAIVLCSLESLGGFAAVAGAAWVRAGIWDRPNGTPQLTGDRPAQGA